ncbi:MAG: primosome assembly protein PriA [Actinomycetia bacterium]|nr:primosome assembly protein PriA [Actinomycetes bacterium]
MVDSPLPHLDRLFDYAIPPVLEAQAQPGVRVRIRMAGVAHTGFIASVNDRSSYQGRLLPLVAVVSPVQVLPQAILDLARAVATHYAGSLWDVVRLAVPARHAATEARFLARPDADWDAIRWPAAPDLESSGDTWPREVSDFLKAVQSSPLVHHDAARLAAAPPIPRANWNVPPSQPWQAAITAAILAGRPEDQAAIVLLPDFRDVATLREHLVAAAIPSESIAILRADLGPAQRYANYLDVLSGRPRLVLGTRGAAFAPHPNLGLLLMWDDGDPNYAELRAPYPHARDVLALRSHLQQVPLLTLGYAQSPQTRRWVETGWFQDLAPSRDMIRRLRPVVSATEDSDRSPFDTATRLSPSAVADLRVGLQTGPVLVQVARSGYIPVSACQRCRTVATCRHCQLNLALTNKPGDDQLLCCRNCGADTQGWRCAECAGTQLRSVGIGAGRTAHELGRLLPGFPIQSSTAEHPIALVQDSPTIVVATAGMEPTTELGYTAGFLPDAQSDLWRAGAQAQQEAFRRWCNAARHLRPGAPLRVGLPPDEPALQALIRWDPAGAAERELLERRELRLPPAVRLVKLTGPELSVSALVDDLPTDLELEALGPRPNPETATVDMLLTARDGAALVAAVRAAVVRRATAKLGEPVRVQVDPTDLG